MLNKYSKIFLLTTAIFMVEELAEIKESFAQTAQQNSSPNSTIGNTSDNNLVIQTPNQNNAQNRNEINIPNIYPLPNYLQTPVNTENDFSLNMSMGVNTLDANNVTVYLGLLFQPGRTEDHNYRMQRLKKESDYLETQKKVAEHQLQLLQKQIAEAELRLQQLNKNSPQEK
jgi:hypothetical protein